MTLAQTSFLISSAGVCLAILDFWGVSSTLEKAFDVARKWFRKFIGFDGPGSVVLAILALFIAAIWSSMFLWMSSDSERNFNIISLSIDLFNGNFLRSIYLQSTFINFITVKFISLFFIWTISSMIFFYIVGKFENGNVFLLFFGGPFFCFFAIPILFWFFILNVVYLILSAINLPPGGTIGSVGLFLATTGLLLDIPAFG